MLNKLNFTLSPYTTNLEPSWIKCKTLSYLYSQFIDQISPIRDNYSEEINGYKDTIELVALSEDKVIGLIDVGIYSKERSHHDLYVPGISNGSYLEIIAVHPDY